MVCKALNNSRHTHYVAMWDENVQVFQNKLESLDKLVEKSPDNTLYDEDIIGKSNAETGKT